MLNSLVRGGMSFAASFCAVVLLASCGVTPLYYSPVDDKSPAEMFDAEARNSLLKGGKFKSDDGDVTVLFSECTDSAFTLDLSSDDDELEKYALRGDATIINEDDDKKDDTWLPVLLVPFRHAGSLFFYLTLDNMSVMEKAGLHPEYLFMMRPYSYILKAEAKDGGWEVGFVQFATKSLELKKITDRAKTDDDGTVFNPPAEILDMLKDPKNYELSSKIVFQPVKETAPKASSGK